jgi:hypothetical protein
LDNGEELIFLSGLLAAFWQDLNTCGYYDNEFGKGAGGCLIC